MSKHAPEWQRFEYTGGTSNKFWEIRVHGSSFTTRFGRIDQGHKAQESTRSFADAAAAYDAAEKLTKEKVNKGYLSYSTSPATLTRSAKKASKPKARPKAKTTKRKAVPKGQSAAAAARLMIKNLGREEAEQHALEMALKTRTPFLVEVYAWFLT
jgi:predicted DNA-binding WGR domain protein